MYISKRKLVLTIVILVFISFAWGFVSSYSNFYGSYPSFTSKTMKPMKPFSKSNLTASSYRNSVLEYQTDGSNYINAANNDISTIYDEITKARNSVNQVVNEYNTWVQTGF